MLVSVPDDWTAGYKSNKARLGKSEVMLLNSCRPFVPVPVTVVILMPPLCWQ